MLPLSLIEPVVTFRNSQGTAVRGTLTSLQRRALVLEIYNPYSIIQVSEVVSELTLRAGQGIVYQGRGVVTSLLNTGLMAVVSVTLTDEWIDLTQAGTDVSMLGEGSKRFVSDWSARFRVRRSYQVAVSEARAFLSDAARWLEQADVSLKLPREADGRLREDAFAELSEPLIAKGREFMTRFEVEARSVPEEDAVVHRDFAQAALHPLILRAPFVHRSFIKPLGYAGDYEMVNQIAGDPRQGSSTYLQMVNALYLNQSVAVAHRNRIRLLRDRLDRLVARSIREGRPMRVLNVGCGPAIEVQATIAENPQADHLQFDLVDFNAETLEFVRGRLAEVARRATCSVQVNLLHESVHDLLRRASRQSENSDYDLVYCAGLFDYLSDKVCSRLLGYFAGRTRVGGSVLVTNVHSQNPERYVMEHLAEWYLIYRSEESMAKLLPPKVYDANIFADDTGVNVFAEFHPAAG